MSRGTIVKPGDVYNHLTVIERVEDKEFPDKEKKARFLCECDCNDHNRIIVIGENLRNGHTKSCGCLANKIRSSFGKNSIVHGLSKTKEAVAYYHMVNRHPDDVCERWAKDNPDGVVNFYNDMHISYKPGCRLSKKYLTREYSPENCYWS